MDPAWNALVLAGLWGAADLFAPVMVHGSAVPRAAGRLAALGVLALLGFAACGVGFPVGAAAPDVENVGPNVFLTAWLMVPGVLGLGAAFGRAWRRGRGGRG